MKQAARSIADADAATQETRTRAETLCHQADAHILLPRVIELLDSDNWSEARDPLERIRSAPDLPSSVKTRIDAAAATLKRYSDIERTIRELDTRSQKAAGEDPAAAKPLLEDLRTKLDTVSVDANDPSGLHSLREAARTALDTRLRETTAELERIIARKREEAARLEKERKEDRKAGEAYLAKLQAALDGGEWAALDDLLSRRPTLKHSLEGFDARYADYSRSLQEHVEEEKRRTQIQADRQLANDWIARVRAAVDAEDWAAAEKVLADKPELTYPPQELQPQEQDLVKRLRIGRRRDEDYDRARAWLATLETAVSKDDWQQAAEVLTHKPDGLEYWPPEAIETAARHEAETKRRIDAIELESRQAREWLDHADEAAKSREWQRALRILESPPQLAHWPAGLRERADELRHHCTRQRDAEIRELREKVRQRVEQLGQSFARTLVAERMRDALDPQLIEITVGDVEFTAPGEPVAGNAELRVALRDKKAPTQDRFSGKLNFEVDGGTPRLRDDRSVLAEGLISHLRKVITRIQEARLPELVAPLRLGLFPEARINAPYSKLTDRLTAEVLLCPTERSNEEVTTEITWSPNTLEWTHADPVAFTRRALDIATQAAHKAVGTRILDDSTELRAYKPLLALSVRAVMPKEQPDRVPNSLTLDVQLTITPGEDTEARALHRWSVTCPQVGKVASALDLRPAEAALRHTVIAGQNALRDEMVNELAIRLKDAPVRMKVRAIPRRITAPLSELHLEVKPRRGTTTDLTASWHAETFSFVPMNQWDDTVAGLVALTKPEPPWWVTHKKGVAAGAIAPLVIGVGFVVYDATSSPPACPEAQVQQDRSAAVAYIAELESVFEGPQGDWQRLGQLLQSKPDLKCPPEEFEPRVAYYDGRLRDHLAEEQRLAATAADKQLADSWLADLRQSIDDGRLDEADELLASEPELTYPPAVFAGQKQELIAALRAKRTRQADVAKANEYLERLKKAVEGEDWTEAELALEQRPELQSWPAGVPEELERYRTMVQRHGEPPPRTPPSAAAATEVVRAILTTSPHITNAAAEELVRSLPETTGTPDGAPVLEVATPGLVNPIWQMQLVDPDGDGQWRVRPEDQTELEERVAELERLLTIDQPLSTQPVLPEEAIAGLAGPDVMNPDRLRLALRAKPQWIVSGDGWRAEGVEAALVFLPDGKLPEIELAAVGITLTLDVIDGALTPSGIADDEIQSIQDQVPPTLHGRQLDAARDCAGELKRAFAADPIVSDSPFFPDDQERPLSAAPLEFVITSLDGMLDRTFIAEWDPLALRFVLQAGWKDRAEALMWERALLQELNSAMADDHWIRTASASAVFELSLPEGDTWRLGVTAPWADKPDTRAASLAELLPLQIRGWIDYGADPVSQAHQILDQLQLPGYWGLVEKYLDVRRRDQSSLITDFAVSQQHRPLQDYLSAGGTIISPRWELAGATDVEATGDGPSSLILKVTSGWQIDPAEGAAPPELAGEALARLRTAINGLGKPAACRMTLELVDNATVAPAWSGTRSTSEWFTETVPQIAALNRRLLSLSARADLDRNLADLTPALADGASNPIDGGQAIDLLRRIWAAKAAGAARVDTLAALTAHLRSKDRLGRRGRMGKPEEIPPTVFVEYFVGPQNAYAIVWSARPRQNEATEGPTLVRLCSTATLASQRREELGKLLLDPVLDVTPSAIRAADYATKFDSVLGLVLAPDDWMGGIHSLETLQLTPRNSYLRPTRSAQQEGIPPAEVEWDSLDDLLGGKLDDRICAFKLTSALSDGTTPWRAWNDTDRWAAQTLTRALQAHD
ncbi:MAG: hypothetical protein ACE5HE_06080 [Phycisphaerae bacterium]